MKEKILTCQFFISHDNMNIDEYVCDTHILN